MGTEYLLRFISLATCPAPLLNTLILDYFEDDIFDSDDVQKFRLDLFDGHHPNLRAVHLMSYAPKADLTSSVFSNLSLLWLDGDARPDLMEFLQALESCPSLEDLYTDAEACPLTDGRWDLTLPPAKVVMLRCLRRSTLDDELDYIFCLLRYLNISVQCSLDIQVVEYDDDTENYWYPEYLGPILDAMQLSPSQPCLQGINISEKHGGNAVTLSWFRSSRAVAEFGVHGKNPEDDNPTLLPLVRSRFIALCNILPLQHCVSTYVVYDALRAAD